MLGPTYVSPNTVVGDKECAIFFPEDYEEPEPEIIEEVKKKHKKRGRGSKTSVTSTTASKTSQESSEGQTGNTDEGLEEVLEEGVEDEEEEEEEGLDELTATDDALDLDAVKDYEDGAIDMPGGELPIEANKATSPMESVPE